jgi:DNA modification methylase
MSYTLYHGDCLEVMGAMEAESVTSIVTDPPYGLSDHPQAEVLECLRAWINGEVYKPKGRGFMGARWDSWVPGPEIWRECLRVLKPGGHMLVFAGTRSMDLMSMAIRLAGFELRDNIGYAHSGDAAPLLAWCFGSGFPKSHSISAAIDAKLGAEREVVGVSKAKNSMGRLQESLLENGARKYEAGLSEQLNVEKYGGIPITVPATDAARLFHNYGSALKPAWEPIIICMKPLDKTYAHNALAHGLAGLNIDGCRVPISDGATMARHNAPGANGWKNSSGGANSAALHGEPSGRWPANLIHDGSDEVMAVFDKAGESKSSGNRNGEIVNSKARSWKNSSVAGIAHIDYSDSGSAARFFYCAKSSTAERSAGVDDGNAKVRKFAGHHNNEQDDLTKRMGTNEPQANFHPTVKPIELCRWLCRLVKPPTGGVILDPFMGSGSSGVAALLEGVDFIGIEREAEYIEIARQRLEHYEDERSTEPIKLNGKASDFDNLPMFAEVAA